MADEADLANDLIANEVSSVLEKLRRDGPAKKGPEHCVTCEDPIPAARRKMGFELCVSCAAEAERRDALFGG